MALDKNDCDKFLCEPSSQGFNMLVVDQDDARLKGHHGYAYFEPSSSRTITMDLTLLKSNPKSTASVTVPVIPISGFISVVNHKNPQLWIHELGHAAFLNVDAYLRPDQVAFPELKFFNMYSEVNPIHPIEIAAFVWRFGKSIYSKRR